MVYINISKISLIKTRSTKRWPVSAQTVDLAGDRIELCSLPGGVPGKGSEAGERRKIFSTGIFLALSLYSHSERSIHFIWSTEQ
jgi:hypothetical protein